MNNNTKQIQEKYFSTSLVSDRERSTPPSNHISLSELDLIDVDLSLYAETDFVSTWQTNLTSGGSSGFNQISLPLESSGTYDFTVDWGDGTSDTITSWDQPETNHTYSSSGQYVVTISGTLIGWSFDNTGDRLKIVEISQWGNLNLGNTGGYFAGTENLVISATDTPDLNGTTNFHNAFYRNRNLGSIQNLDSWDVSQVTNMSRMFQGTSSFNQSLSSWNVSKVTDMFAMFLDAESFNQSLNSWDVSQVIDMSYMFSRAESFNQPLDSWDTSQVTDMSRMFHLASNFNQPLNSWNVSKVTDMSWMFLYSQSFDHSLNGWDVSNVTNMEGMFAYASSFNQPLHAWDFPQLTSMERLFLNTINFNQLLDYWDVSHVRNMYGMFSGAESFNQPLDSWDVSSVTDMSGMFSGAESFNQPLDTWDVSSVTDMSGMFSRAESFNQPLDTWDVSQVTNMNSMFAYALNFNQSLSPWDVSQVSEMSAMFQYASNFNQPLSSWDVSNVTEMRFMFVESPLSTKNYDNLLISWSQLNVQRDVTLGAGDVKYSNIAQSARDTLIETYGWDINDYGLIPEPSTDNPSEETLPTDDNELGSYTLFLLSSIALVTVVTAKRRLQKI